jgi:type IV secretion system protein VirD4
LILDIKKFLEDKNLDKKVSEKLLDDKFIKKMAIAILVGTISFINLLMEFTTKSIGALLGGDKPSIFGMFNFSYTLQFFPIYLIAIIIVLLLSAKLVLNLKDSFESIEDGQKGTASFTTRQEIDEQYKSVPLRNETYEGGGGVPIAWSKEKNVIYIDDSPVNNLIIGTTRSGKGETFVVPTIDIYSRATKKPSMIINDPKGELVAMSKETLEQRGYEVLMLNLTDPLNSMSYNPLTLIIDAYKREDFGEAQLLCQTLTYSIYNDPNTKDAFWQNTAMSLTNALILALCEECINNGEEHKITLYTVANMLNELGVIKKTPDGKEYYEIDNYFDRMDNTSVAKMQYSTTKFAKENTKGSILVSSANKLNMFTFEKIAKMTSKNSLDFKSVGFPIGNEKPKAIFMVTPDYDKSIHVIASIFVRQMYYVLAKESTLSIEGKCDREVIFLLDEFGNMPPIEGMANIITVCLGRKIRFNLIVQAYSQLKNLYGDDAPTIEGNCGNQIYILTNEDETAEKFSKLVGEKTIITKSRSGDKYSLEKNHSESLDARRLLTSQELRALKMGESVIVRVIKRSDKEGNRIVPKPIFNNNEYAMKHRYEYLSDTFNNSKSFLNIKVDSLHKDVDCKELAYSYKSKEKKIEEIKENENKAQQILNKNIKSNEEKIDKIKENDRVIELNEDIKDNLKKYLEDMNLFNYEIGDLIDKSKTFNYLLEKIDEDEVKNEISQFMVMQKV